MAGYTKEQRVTSSRKKCLCSETLDVINKGDRVLYIPNTKKVYCKNSEKFKKFIKWQTDQKK